MKTKEATKNEDQCLGCGKHVENNEDLSVCTGCFEASFCSTECQRMAWPTHRFDCVPCSLCGKRIPGVPIHRDCACENKKGDSHVECLVTAAAEDSGDKEWDHTSTLWEKCNHCGEPYTGKTKQVLEHEREARIEKAKERIQDLLQQCHEEGNENRPKHDEITRLSRECIALYRGLYGEEDWSSDEIFRAYIFLGAALERSNRFQEAAQMLELARTKLEQHKVPGWKILKKEVTMGLGKAYFRQRRHREALPLFEEAYENYYLALTDSSKLWLKNCLARCYHFTGAWKKALEMVEQVSKQTEDDTPGIRDELNRLRINTIKSWYIVAKTHGMDGVPDGVTVEVKSYSNSRFGVSDFVDRDVLFKVPVEQVIMAPDSDIVLHSLRGAKHLNGKLGVIEEFYHELGRYKVIVQGIAKAVNVKPANLLPAHMGCEKEEMVDLALELSNEDD